MLRLWLLKGEVVSTKCAPKIPSTPKISLKELVKTLVYVM